MDHFLFSIKEQLPASLSVKASKDKNSQPSFQTGEMISALITDRTADKVTLATKDNRVFTAAADKVTGEVGDEVRFEVMSAGKDGTVLKQVQQSRHAAQLVKKQNIKGMNDLLRQNNLSSDDKSLADSIKEQNKEAQAVADVQRDLAYSSDNSAASAVRELLKSGVSLNKMSLPVMNSVMREIDNKPAQEITSEQMTAISDKLGAAREKFAAVKNLDDSAIAKLVIDG